MSTQIQPDNFVETALRLSGKTEEEARRTGSVDRADDQVEALFAPHYRTVDSPVHRAVWDRRIPVDAFRSQPCQVADDCRQVMDDSLDVVRRHREAGTLVDEANKITPAVLEDLASAGYWGLLVDREYGGLNAPMAVFAPFLTRMATVSPTTAGLASVHGCIGAVDPLSAFGDYEQKARFLPSLASGRRLSAFALTEPCAGSDLTALRTTATLEGDHYLINGEKLFITNATCGRTIALVALVEGRPQVLILDLPPQENDQFRIVRYGLHALKQLHNHGLVFKNFRVPRDNLLDPGQGDGLTIAYHGLNRGRVSLCANAAGTMRTMLANLLPWGKFRKTYGQPIEKRELVRRRIARLAGLIVSCDALVAWCSWLLDQGYRGEMECIVAKIFGSEAQKEAAIELLMKTHGGRAFLHGHLLGDNVHEYLAPCIYEGEGEMLAMALFKSLVKEHGREYFEPIGQALSAAGIRQPNLANPRHLWQLKGPMLHYGTWWLGEHLRPHPSPRWPNMPAALKAHADFAADHLARARREISGVMRKHQLRLPDRQLRVSELSQRIQDLVVMLVTAVWAADQSDERVQLAADVACHDLARKLTGRRATDRDFRRMAALGEAVADDGFAAIAGVEAEPLLMPYGNEPTPTKVTQ